MATVKNEVFIGLLHENFYSVGRKLTFVEGGGEIVQVRGELANFCLVGGLPPIPQ